MGGIGSRGTGKNRYTKRKEWHEKYGVNVPYVYVDKDGVTRSIEYGAKFNDAPRSKSELVKFKCKTEFDKLQKDIANTLNDISKYEEHEKIVEFRNSPEGIARKKLAERERKRLAGIVRDNSKRDLGRFKNLPKDLVCPKCGLQKFRSKQWVVRDNTVCCRVCFEKLRKEVK
jgi:hypothetical protein